MAAPSITTGTNPPLQNLGETCKNVWAPYADHAVPAKDPARAVLAGIALKIQATYPGLLALTASPSSSPSASHSPSSSASASASLSKSPSASPSPSS